MLRVSCIQHQHGFQNAHWVQLALFGLFLVAFALIMCRNDLVSHFAKSPSSIHQANGHCAANTITNAGKSGLVLMLNGSMNLMLYDCWYTRWPRARLCWPVIVCIILSFTRGKLYALL